MRLELRNQTEVLAVSPGEQVRLPALWLRERAMTPDQVDLVSGQRLIDPHRLPADLRVVAASIDAGCLQLEFSDGYRGAFASDALLAEVWPARDLPQEAPWTRALEVRRVDFSALHDARAMHAALAQFLREGFLLLTDTPARENALVQVATHFGHIRTTNFGQLFNVQSEAGSVDLAYREVALAPHTDNPYRVPTPGIQLLHCIVHSARGGESTLVDALAVLGRLRDEDPEGLNLLAELPVRFRYRDGDNDHRAEHPIVTRDAEGRCTGIHYSPRLDALPLVEESVLQRYQQARRRLSELLSDAEFEIRLRLSPGDCIMMDNNRVLHGRAEFDANSGDRFLQGCYIDRDGPVSRYRMLTRELRKE